MWENLGKMIRAGGGAAVLVAVVLGLAGLNIYLVGEATGDRYTGTEAEHHAETQAAKDAAQDAERARLESSFNLAQATYMRTKASDEQRYQRLEDRMAALETGIQQWVVSLTQMSKDVSYLVKRAEEDRAINAEFRKALRDLAERLVKVEAWRDGPERGK